MKTSSSHSGKNALKTSSDINGAARVQKSLSALGATAGTHWGRIFFKVQSPAPQLSSQGPHVTFVARGDVLALARASRLADATSAYDDPAWLALFDETPRGETAYDVVGGAIASLTLGRYQVGGLFGVSTLGLNQGQAGALGQIFASARF